MSAPAHVHAQRILHALRDVELTVRQASNADPGSPAWGEVSSELGLVRTAVERAFEDLA